MKAQINGQTFEYTDKTLTVSKSVGIYECEFEFDSSWDGYDKTAVFQNGTTTIEVVITDGVAQIPWEVLTNIGYLCVGVYGTKDEKVMPTIWGNKLKIQSGTPTGSIGTEPTPSIYAQILEVATEAKEIAEDVQTEWGSVSATAETLPSGSSATASFNGEVFSFGIPQGERGADGTDGFSPIVTVAPITNGYRVTITDAEGVHTFDMLDGTDGADGVGITNIVMNADYTLTITLSNGTSYTTPSIRGEQGEKGETGNGIASITKTATVGKVDTYTITYTDGTTTTFDVTNGEVTEASLEEALYDKADVILNSASGSIASFDDGAEMPVKSLEVEINAVQDLHGQSSPYPAGGGKNLINPSDFSTWATVTNNVITFDGSMQSGQANAIKVPCVLTSGTTVTISVYSSNSTTYYVRPKFFNGDTQIYDVGSYKSTTLTQTVTLSADVTFFSIGVKTSTSATTLEGSVKIQVEVGSTATAFAPYENICPISGWNAVNVVRTGRNLLETTLTSQTRNGITYTVNSDGTIQVQGTASALSIVNIGSYVVREDATYYASGCPSGGSASTYRMYCSWGSNEIGNGSQRELTAGTTVTLQIAIASGITINATYKPMFCKLSDGTAYEPYNGDTYPISLGQTVYGGVLDVTSGVLTINKTIVDLGTLNWTWNNGGWFQTVISDMKYVSVNTEIGNAIAEKYKIRKAQGMSTAPNYEFAIDTSNMKVKMPDNSEEPSGQLVYELATPQTITLTPTEVTTLLGDNNIWADCGDVAVLYRADTKAYIDGTIVDVPLAMIAPIETGTTSSKAYAVGEYFILNGTQFCKAKTAIASGATFTLNTNYTVTTIANELKALQ